MTITGMLRASSMRCSQLMMRNPSHGGGVPWDGFLIINWLQRIDDARSIPVIVITGNDAATYKDRALKAGAVGFFQKPINNEDLLAAINQALTPYEKKPSA